jgi:hypothetical protein
LWDQDADHNVRESLPEGCPESECPWH